MKNSSFCGHFRNGYLCPFKYFILANFETKWTCSCWIKVCVTNFLLISPLKARHVVVFIGWSRISNLMILKEPNKLNFEYELGNLKIETRLYLWTYIDMNEMILTPIIMFGQLIRNFVQNSYSGHFSTCWDFGGFKGVQGLGIVFGKRYGLNYFSLLSFFKLFCL